MTYHLRALTIAAFLGGLAAPAWAACDITDLDCWSDSSKCNIHFKNHTGLATGDSGGTYNQYSLARDITVYAANSDWQSVSGERKISAGGKKTINLDNSQNFTRMVIVAKDPYYTEEFETEIRCGAVRRILSGRGMCHIWSTTSTDSSIAFSCNGKSIIGRGAYETYEIAK